MQSFLISDDQDTLIGMRLAGIKGVMAHNKEEVIGVLNKITSDKETQIIIVTESVLAMAEEEFTELKVKKDNLLVVEIPNRFGPTRGDYITKYIRESIGLRI